MDARPNIGRMLLAMLVCLGIFYGWQQYLQNKYPHIINKETPKETTSSEVIHNEKDATQESLPQQSTKPVQALKPSTPSLPEQTYVFEDDLKKITFSNKGARITGFELKKYDRINLVPNQGPGHLVTELSTAEGPLGLKDVNFKLISQNQGVFTFETQLGDYKVTKVLRVKELSYVVETVLKIDGPLANLAKVSVIGTGRIPDATSMMPAITRVENPDLQYQEIFFSYGSKTSRVTVPHHESTETLLNKEGVSLSEKFEQGHYAAVGSRYFTSVYLNKSGAMPNLQGFDLTTYSTVNLDYPVLDKQAGQLVINLDFFAGPKSLDHLAAMDKSVTEIVDYGMFGFLANPMLSLMKWFYGIFKNYGVAIILLTIIVRLLTFPFNYYSYKSMKSMQKIQPELARLKEIYKDDTQKMNVEVMKLMRENKVNPLGGCLPVLLQLPIFFALFAVLQNSIELYRAPFALWIHDLSLRDPYFVLPVLMGITMFVQQKITPTTMDPAQQKIMLIMPVIFSLFMLGLPSGLTLYIFVSTLFGIAQQLIFMRDTPSAKQIVVRRA